MNEPIGTLSDIQARVAGLTCPFCEQGKLDLVLRCDAHGPDCLLIAQCESCHLQYRVDRDVEPPLNTKAEPHEGDTAVVCSRCGSTDCTVSFRCTVASRRCAYAIVCATCQSLEVPSRPAA